MTRIIHARPAAPHAGARSSKRRRLGSAACVGVLGTLAVLGTQSTATATSTTAARPNFKLPFACKARVELKTYRGHNPDDKKIDMYRVGMPTGSPILASAAGLVHEQFYPGGIEIDHGNGWFTVYLHMKSHVAPGTRVAQGQQIGIMGKVGTGVTHLHYEQLHAPGKTDGDNQDIVNPVLEGHGPLFLSPDRPLTYTSSNCAIGASLPPGPTPPGTTPPVTPPPAPPVAPPAARKFWVDTFANAPGLKTPGGARSGTLNKGRNYVFCKVRGPEVRVGSAFNHYWLKTDLDVGPAGQWVSAYYLTRWGNDVAKDNDGTVIPDC